MNEKYSIWADLFARRPRATAQRVPPAVGEIFVHQPEFGPIEYAQIIGVYEEAAQIQHVRFRLFYGYQEKNAELGERTLAAELFGKRFTQRLENADV